jgi:hypothetical protein
VTTIKTKNNNSGIERISDSNGDDATTRRRRQQQQHRLKAFENTVLRRIFGPRRIELVGGWRKLHEELRNLYSSPNKIRLTKSKRLRWAGKVARIGKKRNAFKILVGPPEGKRPLGKTRRRTIILKWLLEEWFMVVWAGLIWPWIGASGGSYEYGNAALGSIKIWELLELSNWQFLK